ncbi:MAG TPA: hypothetical protein VGD37_20020, partial [Kofleriaceae bacterium]
MAAAGGAESPRGSDAGRGACRSAVSSLVAVTGSEKSISRAAGAGAGIRGAGCGFACSLVTGSEKS